MSDEFHPALGRKPSGLLALWPYLLLFLLFFHPILMGGLFAGGDLINSYLPWKEYWRQCVWRGDWPLWNPLLFCGMPFQANIQSGQFYPPNWLFLLLPGAACFTIVTLLHWVWGVWGMARLAGRLTASRGARFAAAVVFFFSGYFISRMPSGVVLFLFAAAWMPWILDSLIAQTDIPSPKAVLRLGIFLALQLLAGAPQISFYTLIAVALWLPFGTRAREGGAAGRRSFIGRAEPIRKGYRNRAMLGVLAALAIFIALALVQIWPTRDFVRDSFARSRGARWEFVIDGSMSWRFALTQMFPFMFYDPLDEKYFWAAAPASDGAAAGDSSAQHAVGFHEVNAYAGWMAYLLALLAFGTGGRWAVARDRKEPYPINLALIKYSRFLIVFSAILSFGGNSLIFKFFFNYVPGFNLFRDPARVMILGLLGLSLLTAAGWDMILHAPTLPAKARQQTLGRIQIGLCIALFLLMAVALGARALAEALGLNHMQPAMVQGHPNPIYEMLFAALRASLWTGWAWAAGAGALILAGWLAAKKWPDHYFRPIVITCLMGALMLGDLFWYGYRFSTTKTPREFEEEIYRTNSLPKLLQERAKDGSRFVYHDTILGWAWDQNQPEILFCRSMMFGAPNLRGYDPMLLGRYVEFSNLWRLLPKDKSPLTADPGAMLRVSEMESTRLYDVWNARTILSYLPIKAPGLPSPRSIHFEPDKETLALGGANLPTDLLIYDNPNAMGPAWLAEAADGVNLSPAESLARLRDPSFDLRRLALVNSGSCPPPAPAGAEEKIEILSRKSGLIQARVQSAANRLLVVPIPWCMGWRATINGRKAAVLRANHAMMGVVMPGGVAEVRLSFLPLSFVLGGLISLLAWLLCAGVYIKLKISHSNARPFSVSSVP